LSKFIESNQDQQNLLLKTIEYFTHDVLPDLIQDKSDRVLNARPKIRTGCNGPQDPELENALSKLLKRGCHFTFGGFQYNVKYFSKQKFEEVLRDWKYYRFHNSHDIKVPTGCRTNNVCIKITHPAHDESFCSIRDKLKKCKSAASHIRGGHRREHIQCGALSCLEQLDEALAKLTPTERNQKVKKISRTKKKQNLIKNSI